MSDDICSCLVEFLSNVKKLYVELRSKQAFLKKEKKVSDAIHLNNMKRFSSINKQKSKLTNTPSKEKTSKNNLVIASKLIELVLFRNYDGKNLFSYLVVPSPCQFDEEGLMVELGKIVLFREY